LSSDSAYEDFKNQQKLVADKLAERKQHIEKIENSFQDLDTTMNFKVNSLLKTEFEQVCKKSHSNPSREIKLFMLKSIKNNSI
jgi:hypothetical protein